MLLRLGVRRSLCTRASGSSEHSSSKELRQHLRRLYQVVHPDRLWAHPSAREVNKNSFQILQAAIDRHLSSKKSFSDPSPPEQLTFFAHPSEPLRKGAPELREASVILSDDSLGSALESLYLALDLTPPPPHLLPSIVAQRTRRTQKGEFSSLSELTRFAREQLHRAARTRYETSAEAASGPLANEAAILRASISRAHRVILHLGEGLPASGSGGRLEALLRRLGQALGVAAAKFLPGAYAGLRIELNGGRDIEITTNTSTGTPRITLGACSGDDAWRRALESEQIIDACRDMRDRAREIAQFESAAADSLGVRLILLEAGENASGAEFGAYIRILKALREERVDHLITPDVAVMLGEGFQGKDVQEDDEQGVLKVRLKLGAKGIVQAVRERGERLQKAIDEKRKEREAFESLRRALRVDALRRGPDVADAEWHECLIQLKKNVGRLRSELDGLRICIGHIPRVAEDGEVELPVDFWKRPNF